MPATRDVPIPSLRPRGLAGGARPARVLVLLLSVLAPSTACGRGGSEGQRCLEQTDWPTTPSATLEVVSNPWQDDPAYKRFDRCVDVSGMSVFGESGVSDAKLRYVASVLLELLDNDEDGTWDDPAIAERLFDAEAVMPVFSRERSSAERAFHRHYGGQGASAVLYDGEVSPAQPGRWGTDATIEELMHTVNAVGHATVYPDVFGLQPDRSTLTAAMDVARGGQFREMPDRYPEDAWYHYDDRTCDYPCMAIEYIYWAQVTHLGILDDRETCTGIADEWELCSADQLAQKDTAIHAVLIDPARPLPQRAPDGVYAPAGR